jgi:hypothetical protein
MLLLCVLAAGLPAVLVVVALFYVFPVGAVQGLLQVRQAWISVPPCGESLYLYSHRSTCNNLFPNK